MSIDIWRTFKTQLYHSSINKGRVFIAYNLYAWGVPLVIVMIALILDMTDAAFKFKPRYAVSKRKKLCWINSRTGLFYFFLLPVGIIIFENFILFILTSYGIYKKSKESEFAKAKSQSIRSPQNEDAPEDTQNNKVNKRSFQSKFNKTNKIRFALYMKLGILQGLTWMTGFVASFSGSSGWWYVFTLLNGLQGATIFICFDLKKWVFVSFWEQVTKTSWGSRISSKATKTTSPDSSQKKTKGQKSPKDEAAKDTVKGEMGLKPNGSLQVKNRQMCFSNHEQRPFERRFQSMFKGGRKVTRKQRSESQILKESGWKKNGSLNSAERETSDTGITTSGNTCDTDLSQDLTSREARVEIHTSSVCDKKDDSEHNCHPEEMEIMSPEENMKEVLEKDVRLPIIEKQDFNFSGLPPPPSFLSNPSFVPDVKDELELQT
ncbi:UNVERIFIED_CONTAM: hypothetical protein GTU68_011996 [Idotea baltica]|nr:hypothetical protein [Idotea baltica]